MNHTGLYLLPSLFYYTPDREIRNSIKYYCQKEYFEQLKNNEYYGYYEFNPTLFDNTTNIIKYAFVILNGHVSKINFTLGSSDELNNENDKIIESDDAEKIDKKTYEHLNIHLFNPYMDTISTLFQKVIEGNCED